MPITTTPHYEYAVALQAQIQQIGLLQAGGVLLPATQVVLMNLATDRPGLSALPTTNGPDGKPQTILPGIVVSLSEGPEEFDDAFELNYVIYPLMVTMIFAANQVMTLNEIPLRWRKQLRDSVRFQSLVTAQNQFQATYVDAEYRKIIDASLFIQENLFVSQILFKVFNEERYLTF